MNASVHVERLLRSDDTLASQAPLHLATEGVQRYVWESRYGAILIEVHDGQVYVNSQRVEPFEAGAPGQGATRGLPPGPTPR